LRSREIELGREHGHPAGSGEADAPRDASGEPLVAEPGHGLERQPFDRCNGASGELAELVWLLEAPIERIAHDTPTGARPTPRRAQEHLPLSGHTARPGAPAQGRAEIEGRLGARGFDLEPLQAPAREEFG